MTMKRVLLPIAGSSLSTAQIQTAVAVTQVLDAHLEALYIEEESRPPPRAYAMSTQYASSLGRLPTADQDTGQIAEQLHEQRQRASQRAYEKVASACQEAGIKLIEDGGNGAFPVASWQQATGAPRRVVAERATEYDLVVAASSAVTGTLRDIAEAALLEAGRPVLLAPTKLQRQFTQKPVIAWSDSPASWHAVSAALPFLEAAKQVQVVTVNKNRDVPRDTVDRVLAYLDDHGVDADVKVAPPLSRSVGEAILSEASEHGGGMLVMGAYSHSPFAERIFGGATRHVLNKAVATPVLLAH